MTANDIHLSLWAAFLLIVVVQYRNDRKRKRQMHCYMCGPVTKGCDSPMCRAHHRG